ncbi:MAG: ATP-binding protein [Syntrophales bacterium]|nr:ATP-binding protein [Syntrophales bacterium]
MAAHAYIRKAGSWVMISPWIVIGAVVILLPIMILMAVYSIEKQKEAMTQLLAEKGAALILSFEAGARATSGTGPQVQDLLFETAQLPDIAHIIITDMNGYIVAHNNPQKIGRYHGREMDLREIAATEALYYRTISEEEHGEVFEVFRYFSPSPSIITAPFERSIPDDVFRRDHPLRPTLMIFVGLDKNPIALALKADTRITVTLALILLLIGFTGIISLLIVQGYRQARSSLSKVKAFSDSLVEHIPIGIIATDNSAVITSCNRVAESILQIPASRVMGQSAREVLPPALTDLLDRLRGTITMIEEEVDFPLPDNRTVPLDIISTILMEQGSAIGFVMLIRDLTEVNRLKKEIDRSRNLASLGRLAAGVAHEIRNPLSSIKGFATYFRERYRNVPEDTKTADIMISEVDRLNRVISQLLDLSRPIRVQGSTVSILRLVRDSLGMIETRAREQGITIEADLPTKDRTVHVDADGLKQALLNLYINSVESMPGGGKIRVAVEYVGYSGIELSVSDDGCGIRSADLPKIFDPYYTTKPSGTGLGLAIVHKIVEAHGGELQVKSEQGRGSTFFFTITPTLPEPEERPET